jgi:hypothetical protein
MIIPTAVLPSASIGCRTVVSEGIDNPAGSTSSKPITEQSSGVFKPTRASDLIAPKAVMSSKAMIAVKRFLCFSSSSVSLNPLSNAELGSSESGSSATSIGSIGSRTDRAKERTPRQRGAASASTFGPRIKAILRWPSE